MGHQATYKSEKVSLKAVYYTGADTLQEGYLLCYDADRGTAGNVDHLRAVNVEKPADGNLDDFAGVVDEGFAGLTGPAFIKIHVPTADGQKVKIWVNKSVVVDDTDLYLTSGSYAASNSGRKHIGKAMQTVDRSTAAGPAQALLISSPREALRNPGASALFTDAIWSKFPLTDMRADPALGTFVEYEPNEINNVIGTYATYSHGDVTVAVIKAVSLAETDQFVLSHDAATADNEAGSAQFPGPITVSGAKPWAMEISLDVTTVTDADGEMLVGLTGLSTLGNAIPYQDGGAFTAALDLIVANIVVGDGNAIDITYQASGESTVVHDVGPGVPTANTAITIGFYYDGATIQIYVDGTNTADPILASDIADVTSDVFPAAAVMYPTFAVKGESGSGDTDDLNIRAFRFAQLA